MVTQTRKHKRNKSPWCSRHRKTHCRKGIGSLKSGDLELFGYSHVATLSVEERHRSLSAAVKQYGALTVWRKLNAISVLTRRTNPNVSAIFLEDRNWIKSTFMH